VATLDRELDVMKRLVREAAALVVRLRKGDLELAHKGHDGPVTRADREANELVCGGLRAAFPADAVVGEESAPTDEELAQWHARHARAFYVDPIDGTREFASGSPEYCVMAGLAIDGRARAGVVAIPEEDVLLWGEVARGAFVEPLAGGGARRVAIADPAEVGQARAVVSRSHRAANTLDALDRAGIRSRIPCGSVGVKAARLLLGAADVYLHTGRGAKLWDACAPEALVIAAGGRFTTARGDVIDYRGPLALQDGMLAGGALAHTALKDAATFDARRSRTKAND
jgi:3'(2'), 5'-bisphosphate nucleotidase